MEIWVLFPNLPDESMTDVPDLVLVAVVAPIGNSDQRSLLYVGSHFDGSGSSKLVC